MSHTLKLKGDVSLPGLALPEAFASLDSRLESVMQLSVSKGSPEAQVVGLITVCEELKQLLKCAFIENGMLASRIEILTRYQMESSKKMERKVNDADVENKVTRKHMKRLRKKLNAQLVMQKKKESNWWDMAVRTTDYDSFVTLSRAGGYPDLEFMLRVNQLMIDFVSDGNRTELVLPPMGLEERQEVSKLASIYKLRCRYGKSVQIAPSTLLKARQACVPAPGEVDTILNNFARSHVQRKVTEEVVIESTGKELVSSGSGVTKEGRAKPPSIPLPSTMLTPLSSLPSPTVDISSLKNPSHSPPSSALTTPTATGDGSSSSSSISSRFLKQQRDGVGSTTSGGTSGATASVSALTDRKSSVATQSSSRSSTPVTPGAAQRPHPLTTPHQSRILESKKSGIPPSASGKLPPRTFAEPRVPPLHPLPSTSYISGLPSLPSPSLVASSATRLPLPQQQLSNPLPPTSPSVSSTPHPSPLSPVGIVLTPSSSGGTRSPGGGVLVQSQIRGTTSHSTVLAHPIKCPTSPVSPDHQQQGVASLRSLRKGEGNGKKRGGEAEVVPGEESTGGEVTGGGGGSARTDSMGPPVKRVRVTRRTAAEEELAKQ